MDSLILQKAADCNRKGADFCATGNTQKGMQYYRQALNILLNEVMIHDIENHGVDPPSPATKEGRLTRRSQDGDPMCLHVHNPETLFMYETSILFTPKVDERITHSTVALFLAVIEFNMALAFHVRVVTKRGVDGIKKTKHLTNMAVALYDCCGQHVGHALQCSEASTVLVAALKNKAQLMNQELVVGIQEMKGLLDTLGGALVHCRQTPSIFSNEELEEFVLNVMVFPQLKFAAAA